MGTTGLEHSRTEARWSPSGSFTYDGIGKTFGSESVNRNGDYAFDQSGNGQYHGSSDCTGVLLTEDTGEEYARFVVVDGGKGVYIFSENNPVYVVATKM